MIEQCPRCQQRQFKAVELLGVQLQRCGGCRGIWFDPAEFEKVIESSHGDRARESVERVDPAGRPETEAYLPLRVTCPGCGTALLEEAPVSFEFIHHFVMTDRCPDCRSVWLDASELSLIQRYIRSEDEAIAKAVRPEAGPEARPDAAAPPAEISRRGFWRALVGLDAG